MKNLDKALAKKRQIALYASMNVDGMFTVWEVDIVNYDENYQILPDGQTRERAIKGYVRVSELVEAEFSGVDNDTVVRNAVETLNEQERQIRAEFAQKLADLNEQRSQLLALTHQPEPV